MTHIVFSSSWSRVRQAESLDEWQIYANPFHHMEQIAAKFSLPLYISRVYSECAFMSRTNHRIRNIPLW